jgi:peptidoglycan/xylan/chitin deacetylase (PgdA/CDA1 family)
MILNYLKFLISVVYLIFIKIRKITSRSNNKYCVVLYYHSVLDKQKYKFIRQLNYLSNKYSFVSLSSLNKLSSNENLISITFDDGLSSILKNALPELKRREIPTTVFIPAAYIGKYPKWEQKDQKIYYEDRILNQDEIKELSNQGIEIASHTLNHTDLRKVHPEIAKEELLLSKSILEEITGKEVLSFSFPYGSYNDEIINLAFNCGYGFVFTTQPEIISLPSKRRVFGRISIEPDDSLLKLKLKAEGAYSWLPKAIKLKKKIKNLLPL